MEERKNHHEEKNNTGLAIVAIIAILLMIGLIIYFAMGNNTTKDAIDDVKDTTENIINNDNDTKTMSDVAGSYQTKIGNSVGIDEDTAADEEDYIELVLKEDSTASLVITTNSENIITGNYTITDNLVTITSNDTDSQETNNMTDEATINNDNNEVTDNNIITDTNTETYQFTINDDNTLSYMNGNNNVTLKKVKKDALKYIK